MFSHVVLGSNDLPRSKKFYDALFAAIGGPAGVELPNGKIMYTRRGGILLIGLPADGQPATHANGGTIGFAVDGSEQADAWHDAGVRNGGTAIEDAPGFRPSGLYLAYLRDPDGNKICAMYRKG
jgi:catechol 2,3-dioxygenase-like lactoylglutathione lyase family enzyme